MEATKIKVNIIGAGLSGLIAAHLLEDYGFNPVVWEADDRVGGRIKTDIVDGYQLDRGFQVLLDQYPSLKKYLDYDALELQALLPGAAVLKDNKINFFGDPQRAFFHFWTSAFGPVASISDLLKLYKLKQELSKKDLRAHFDGEEQSSLNFLKNYGFSNKVIDNFFKPFYSGIFLESELKTSAKMLQFVYALFAKGNAVIPRKGIEEAPRQIAKKLKRTRFHFNTKIDLIKEGKLIIEGVEEIESDITLIACDPSKLIAQLANDSILWNRLDTFYYEVDKDVFGKAIIGLDPDNELVNHLFYPQSIATASKGRGHLLSLNVVNQKLHSQSDVQDRLERYLKNKLGIRKHQLIKHYQIKKALPQFGSMQYDISAEESQLTENVFLLGDQQVNPSQNAAILSAEAAVSAIVDKMLK
jgi:protoporphyrinogen oxidase